MHLAVAITATIVLVALLLGVRMGLKISTWTLLAVPAAVVSYGAHIAISLWDPNRNPAQNQRQAEQQQMTAVVTPPRHARAASSQPGHGLTWLRLGIIALGCLAVSGMGSAELVRKMNGWVENDALGVLGPGDSFTVSFPSDLASIGGRWKGNVDTELLLSDFRRGRMNGFTWVSRNDTWGNELRGATRWISPWCTVTLPDRKELAGRRISLRLTLSVSHPKRMGAESATYYGTVGKAFVNESETLGRIYDLTIASPFAGRTFRTIWRIFGAGGTAVCLLAGFALALEGLRPTDVAMKTNSRFGRAF